MADSRELHAVEASPSPSSVAAGQGRSAVTDRVRADFANHWPLLVVLALFAGAAVIVPTLTPIATTDDWAYARSAQILLAEGRLEIFPVVAATAVFQVVWGALFGLIFGPELGVFRLSTVVIVAIGAVALYGLCRHLGATAGRAALGAAAYLFNPLAFILAFTFMTDPHFASLLLLATFFYVRGLDHSAERTWEIVVGSAVAALALLTRQQGVLIPLAVAIYLLVARRLHFDRASLVLLLRVGALPAVAAVGYFLWLRFFNEIPDVQESFLRGVLRAGWEGTWGLVRRLSWIGLAYFGLFALPLTVAALIALRRLFGPLAPRALLFLLAWQALLVGGVAAAWATGARMPYIGQFFGKGGLGPPDVLGSRPVLLEEAARGWLTAVCVASALLLGLVFARRIGRLPGGGAAAGGSALRLDRERAGAALVLAIGLWQVVGVLPPSYQYIRRGGSLDRYLLPLLPLVICLALWALREVRLSLPAGWLVVAACAAFSVAGTRDYLVFMAGIWDLAHYANAQGVPNDKLDAGSGWDGYHLYEYSRDQGIDRARTQDAPWWIYFYAPASDSTYLVATERRRLYVPITTRTVDQWLETEPVRLYLLRRWGTLWPPRGNEVDDADGSDGGLLTRLLPPSLAPLSPADADPTPAVTEVAPTRTPERRSSTRPAPPDDFPAILTLKEAAAFARLSSSTAYEMAARGDFPAYRLPGCSRWFVGRDTPRAWLLERQAEALRRMAATSYDRIVRSIDGLDGQSE